MTDVNLVKLPEMPKFLDEGVTPGAKEIGTTLGNIFYMVFSPINHPVEKLRIKQAQTLKKYEQDIQDELNKIPEDKLIEPSLSIVGPALEASKFYIEEDEIRKMFAKLIASSVNIDAINNVHQSFTEIIKQLSPLDASNLMIIFNQKSLPIAKFRLQKAEDEEGMDVNTHVFLSNSGVSDLGLIATSISNLIRLGLIDVDYSRYLSDDLQYEMFENHPLAQSYNNPYNIAERSKLSPYSKFAIKRGLLKISPLGESFSQVCL